jgi:dynein heavy chain, axonemal
MQNFRRSSSREGAYIHGLYMEGARWDTDAGYITNSRLKELFPPMPVMSIKVSHYFFQKCVSNKIMFLQAITQDKQDLRGIYECPVYKTRARGPTYVWTFNLKSREKPSKWALAGVALLLQI